MRRDRAQDLGFAGRPTTFAAESLPKGMWLSTRDPELARTLWLPTIPWSVLTFSVGWGGSWRMTGRACKQFFMPLDLDRTQCGPLHAS